MPPELSSLDFADWEVVDDALLGARLLCPDCVTLKPREVMRQRFGASLHAGLPTHPPG